jgi:RES domain-containing protein
MRVFRLCRKHHGKNQDTALNGVGSYLIGGRWNPAGYHIAYTSETTSLALLEVLAHADLEDLPNDLVVISVNIPDDVSMSVLSPKDLPANWRNVDPAPTVLKQIGKTWVSQGDELLLKVPSVIVPDEYHILINSKHDEIKRISGFKTETFVIDPRLGVGL